MPRTSVFLDAIREDPEGDTRLIFADWLEEQSDPALALRGEFLRLQCRLSGWIPDLEERTQGQTQERKLLEQDGSDWLGPLRGHVTEAHWLRGLAHVTLPAGHFVSDRLAGRWPELFRHAWVEGLRLERPAGGPRQIAGIAANTGLGSISRLDLSSCDLMDDWLRGLLRSPHLGRLARLDLSNNRLTDASAEIFFQSAKQLPGLKALDLRNNGLTDKGVRRLLRSPLGRQLHRLELMGNQMEKPIEWTVEVRQAAAGRRGTPRRLVNSIGMELTLIPAGTFLMGSTRKEKGSETDEHPQHEVTLSRPFYLGVYAVTQQEFERVTGTNPAHFSGERGGGPTHPAERVSWQEAETFCRLLTQQPEEQALGRVYRLPTEAEWEYAARAGTSPDLPTYLGESLSPHQANFNGPYPYNGGRPGPYRQQTLPVGSFPASPWGLYEMHGNVWEWCSDWYSDEYYRESPKVDPPGPERGERRVVRGGSWLNQGVYCRAAARDRFVPDFRYYDNGLRVVLEIAGARPDR